MAGRLVSHFFCACLGLVNIVDLLALCALLFQKCFFRREGEAFTKPQNSSLLVTLCVEGDLLVTLLLGVLAKQKNTTKIEQTRPIPVVFMRNPPLHISLKCYSCPPPNAR